MKIVRAGAYSRGVFLRLAAGAGGLAALGCSREQLQPPLDAVDDSPSSTSPGGSTATRGRSSLALGGHVEGLTPVLVEMGQQDQPLERRWRCTWQ